MTLFPAFGAPGAIRTRDLWLRRPTLYPAELRARVLRMGEQNNGAPAADATVASPAWPANALPERISKKQ